VGKVKTTPASFTLLTDDDLHLFNEGTHLRIYEKLGAHPVAVKGAAGVFFAVFAPNAQAVFVMGDWNGWDKEGEPLKPRGQSGIWEGFVPGVRPGAAYKYHVVSRLNGYRVDKADPYAFAAEPPPRTGSIVAELDFTWGDEDWMKNRARRHKASAPIAIYEVHLGSWRRSPEPGHGNLNYREIAPLLAD
jgi:1,4-alpha-glucan branching enzyme